MEVNKLTDREIQSMTPKQKMYRVSDGDNLYLNIHPNGSKTWLFRYRFSGKRKDIQFGGYPVISLKAARLERDEYKTHIRHGKDPSELKKQAKNSTIEEDTFKTIALEWFETYRAAWAANTIKQKKQLLKLLVPSIGNRRIDDIKTFDLQKIIRPIYEAGKVPTAHHILGICNQIFRYARVKGHECRVTPGDLRMLFPSKQKNHYAAATKPDDLANILLMLDNVQATPVVTTALKLLPMLAVRPNELLQAKWADIDFNTAEWRYITSKTQTPHIVPLARQAIATLKTLYPLTGKTGAVFFSFSKGYGNITPRALLDGLRNAGIPKHLTTAHGFRATARTMLDEELGYDVKFIEHQLAHTVRDPLGRAYNRTAFIKERHEMMQTWADYLEQLKRKYISDVALKAA